MIERHFEQPTTQAWLLSEKKPPMLRRSFFAPKHAGDFLRNHGMGLRPATENENVESGLSAFHSPLSAILEGG